MFYKGDTDIESGQCGHKAVVTVERGEADVVLLEQQEQLQNLQAVVVEVEDEKMLDANVQVEIVGAAEEVVDQEDQGADQGAVGGEDNDQQGQEYLGEGREDRVAKPKKEKKKKEKKKKVRGEEGAGEADVDFFEVKI